MRQGAAELLRRDPAARRARGEGMIKLSVDGGKVVHHCGADGSVDEQARRRCRIEATLCAKRIKAAHCEVVIG
jgi:hypothetical protein